MEKFRFNLASHLLLFFQLSASFKYFKCGWSLYALSCCMLFRRCRSGLQRTKSRSVLMLRFGPEIELQEFWQERSASPGDFLPSFVLDTKSSASLFPPNVRMHLLRLELLGDSSPVCVQSAQPHACVRFLLSFTSLVHKTRRSASSLSPRCKQTCLSNSVSSDWQLDRSVFPPPICKRFRVPTAK